MRRLIAPLIGLCVGIGAVRADTPPAAATPPALEAYGQLPTIEFVALSPSGDRLAFVARDKDGAKIYARQIDGPLLMAAPVTDGIIDRLGWAGEDIVLASVWNIIKPSALKGYTHEGEVGFILNLQNKKSIQVFKDAVDVGTNVVGFYGSRQVGGRWFGYYGGDSCGHSEGCGVALFKVDLQTGAFSKLDRSESWASWQVDGVGDAAARLTFDTRNARWELVASKTDKLVAQGASGFNGVDLLGPGRTPDTALIYVNGDDGFHTLKEVRLAGDTPPQALTQGQEVTTRWADPDTQMLQGYTYSDDVSHDVLFDRQTQMRVDAARKAFPGKVVSIASASRDFTRLIAETEGGDDSGTDWLVDLKTGKASILGSAYPHVPPAQTATVSVFNYKASDGLALEAILTLPPGRDAKALPVVVIPHDGPERRDRLGFNWLAQAFASRGYAVLQPNYRGSEGFGAAFRDAGFNQWGRKMQTDVSDGLSALAQAGIVDLRRACILGRGYGGYVALAAVTVQQGLYRCAVAVGALGDLPALFAEKVDPYNRLETTYWSKFIGADQAGVNLDQLSPAKLAARADAPVLIVDVKADWEIQIDQTAEMERALRQAGKPVEVVTIDNYDFLLRRADTRTALLKAAVAFVEQHNPSDDK
ncbi:MAG: alpha/beta hydrolase family protein [Caulobacterales bacterium]